MAELSEADKRAMLGDKYKEVLEKAQKEGRAQSSTQQLWASRVEKYESNKLSAIAIAVVGTILFVSNLYAVSGPSVVLVGASGIGALLVGTGWYVFLWRTLRHLHANQPAH
jgi:uncharacterized membrane protein YgdD (TMEM256/DUF423 family)